MKNFKKLLTITTIAYTTLSSTIPIAHASNLTTNNTLITQSNTIQPRVNWTGNAYISNENWCNITSSNNFFPDSPKVTNHAGNPGTIKVRVIDNTGKQIGNEKTIKVGNSTTLDQIPAFSGTYTLQAKASKDSGIFTITID